MDPKCIADDELLYRCVRKSDPDSFKDGIPQPSLFIDKKGASFSRDGGRSEIEVVNALADKVLRNRKPDWGGGVKITAGLCRRAGTYPVAVGNKTDLYHAEVHDSENEIKISLKKAVVLSKLCEVVGTLPNR